MARVKKGVNAHKRHKKVLKQAKGFYGRKKNTYRAANTAVMRSLRSASLVVRTRRESTEDSGSQESVLAQELTELATADLWTD